jgi:hypothetical protein
VSNKRATRTPTQIGKVGCDKHKSEVFGFAGPYRLSRQFVGGIGDRGLWNCPNPNTTSPQRERLGRCANVRKLLDALEPERLGAQLDHAPTPMVAYACEPRHTVAGSLMPVARLLRLAGDSSLGAGFAPKRERVADCRRPELSVVVVRGAHQRPWVIAHRCSGPRLP